VLTAAHVLGGLEASPPAEGSPVDHYGDAHTPVAGSGGAVGTVGQRIPGARTGPTTVAEIDAGLVRLTAGVAARNLIMGRRVTGVRRFMFDDDLEAEIPVAFVGAASRERRGLLFTARSEFRVKVANVGERAL
jgi:hypothetical protein